MYSVHFAPRGVQFSETPFIHEEPSGLYELYITPRRHPCREVDRAPDDRRRRHAGAEIRQTNGTLNKTTAIAKHVGGVDGRSPSSGGAFLSCILLLALREA